MGDCNTHFFHQRVNIWQHKNTIVELLDQNSDGGIKKVIIDYFKSMSSSQSNPVFGNSEVIDAIEGKVSEEMNRSLVLSFTAEEVKNTLFQTHPSKSLGPDGMPHLFFKKYWPIVGTDASNVVISILSSGQMLRKINFTNVALILKQPHPRDDTTTPYKSLYVVYKIISKVLATG